MMVIVVVMVILMVMDHHCMMVISIASLPSTLLPTLTGSGLLEFGEFCQLAAKFLVEEDEEALKKELKEAFR